MPRSVQRKLHDEKDWLVSFSGQIHPVPCRRITMGKKNGQLWHFYSKCDTINGLVNKPRILFQTNYRKVTEIHAEIQGLC